VKAASAVVARRTILVEKAGAPQALLMMGMPGLDRASDDIAAVQVAFQILGGGSASRLFRHLREEHGYTYGIYARADARRLAGSSLVLGSVKAEVTGAALKDLLGEFETLRQTPVSAGELKDARDAIALELPASFATAAGIASKLADEAVYGLPDDYWDRYVTAISAVSAADVQRVAQKYLDLDRLTTVMVGPASALRPQLEGLPLGPIEVRSAPAR
jgi:predicted Zn-dependent peptidase